MAVSRTRLLETILPLIFLMVPVIAQAQSPTYGLGRSPNKEEITALDIGISPSGKELPSGKGTAQEGAKVYSQKCAACHGATGSEGQAPALVATKKDSSLPRGQGRGRVIITYSPFATTIWDYINRAMPLKQGGTLKADEVYAVMAFLLYKNGVIAETDVLDQTTLPKVKMPNREGFTPPALEGWKPGRARPFNVVDQ